MLLLILLDLDYSLFLWINQGIANGFLDWLMPAMRNKYIWIPLYIFILSFIFFNYSFRIACIYVIFLLLSVAVSDMSSSRGIKPYVKRDRPCNHPVIKEDVRLLVSCGSGYSFTSSHATNHFALSLFLIYTLGKTFRRIRWPLFFWALIVSFAQVYVGLHFPLDVIFGASWGMLIGSFFATIYNGWVTNRI